MDKRHTWHTQPRGCRRCYPPQWYLYAIKLGYRLTLSQNIDDQRIPRHYWSHPNESSSSRCYLRIDLTLTSYWWSKNPILWLDEKLNWSHQIKNGCLMSCLLSMITYMHKIYGIDQFLPEILVIIKEYCNLIGRE